MENQWPFSMMRGLFLSITILVALQPSASQDLGKDLAMAKRVFEDAKDLSLQIGVKVFSSDEKTIYEDRIEIWKKGEQLYYQMGKVEIYRDNHYLVTVNHEQQVIHYSWSAASVANDKDLTPGIDLFEAISSLSKVEYLGSAGDTKHYRTEQEGYIKQADLYISERTGFLSRLEYTYDPSYNVGSRATIAIHELDTNPVFQEGFFSLSRFFRFGDSEVTGPSNRLRGYRVNRVDRK